MNNERREFAWISLDLGADELDPDANRKKRRPFGRRRKQPDFFALFAADGLRQLETYLAKCAAHDDELTA